MKYCYYIFYTINFVIPMIFLYEFDSVAKTFNTSIPATVIIS